MVLVHEYETYVGRDSIGWIVNQDAIIIIINIHTKEKRVIYCLLSYRTQLGTVLTYNVSMDRQQLQPREKRKV